MAIVTEIINVIGFEGSITPLDNLQKGLTKSADLSLGLTGMISGAVAAIAVFTTVTLSSVDAVGQLSRVTGLAVEDIEEMGYAASVTGSSASAMEGTLASLTQRIGSAAINGDAAFQRIGLSVRNANGETKDALQIFGEIGDRLQSFGEKERISLAGSLGIDSSLIQLLNKSSKEIGKLRGEAVALGVVSGKDADMAIQFNDSLTTLGYGITSIQRQLAIGLAPEIMNITEGFIDLLTENKAWIGDGIKTTISGIKTLGQPFVSLSKVINGFIKETVGWKTALVVVGGAFAIAFAPITTASVGIAAILLVIDDLVKAAEGGQSVIADFFKEFDVDIQPAMKKMVADFKNGIKELKEDIKGFSVSDSLGLKNPFSGINTKGLDATIMIGKRLLGIREPEKVRLSGNGGTTIHQNVDINLTAPDEFSAAVQVQGVLQDELSAASAQAGNGGQ